jgi:transposase-like protein
MENSVKPINCPKCNSIHIKKEGKKYNVRSEITGQYYKCNDCGKWFSIDIDGLTRGQRISITQKTFGREKRSEITKNRWSDPIGRSKILKCLVCKKRHAKKNSIRKNGKPFSSKFKGVHFNKSSNKYMSCICVKYKRIFLGEFKNEVDAAYAYDYYAIKYFGKCARINFPETKDKLLLMIHGTLNPVI